MEFQEFANDLEESGEYLKLKLMDLHPWDKEWDLKTTVKLVPFYKEQIDLEVLRLGECSEDDFDKIVRFSSILDLNQVKLLFMEQLNNTPLILDDKYLKTEERIELLREFQLGRLKRVDSNIYLFFNHEKDD